MAHAPGKESMLSAHQQSIRTTYGVLVAGFLLMVGINLAAYWMFLLINDNYRQQDRALVNGKLEVINAHLQFQEVRGVAGLGGDMNEVWQKLRRAKAHFAMAVAQGVDQGLLTRLETYHQALLATTAGIIKAEQGEDQRRPVDDELMPLDEPGDEPTAPASPAERWAAAMTAYGELLAAVERVEDDFAARMQQKMAMVKFLYGALFLIMLMLFAVLLYSLRSYIAERRQAEDLLTESRNTLRTIFDSLNALVVVVGPQGEIQHCNLSTSKYFGWNREEVRGGDLWQLVPWLAKYQQPLSQVFYSGQPLELYRERVAIGATERAFNLSFHAAPTLAGVILRIDDVTMQEIQEMHARQIQQMHLLRNLVRSLANDFNNVLGAIGGTLSLMRLASAEEDGGNLADHFETMNSAMERAAMMVRQMSSLAGEPEAKLRPLDLGERLRHVLNVIRNNLPQGIQMQAEMPRGRALVSGHDRLIEQVMVNLVDNAVAAINEAQTGEGEAADAAGLLTVQLDQIVPDQQFRSRQPQATAASYWAIHVGDSGAGMTPEVAARIFEPFYTTRTVTRSAGLGLSLVEEIVERLGGFIEVRSAPGQGTVISFYIPELSDATEFLMREAAVAESAASPDGIPLGSGLVLVVDDEPVMRKTAANILAKLGYAVETAEGGREAVAIFRQRHAEIAMVMLDLAMPEMGGKETFLEMREIDPSVPALMASGYQQDELVDEALQLGIAGFIRKPYRLSTLAQEIDRIMRLHGRA